MAHSRKKVPRSLRLRSIVGLPFEAVRSRADSSSSSEEPCPPREGIPGETGAAQDKPGHGCGQDDQREGYGEEVERHEGNYSEANENAVVDGALANPQDRLYHNRYHHRLYPIEETGDRRHV